MAVQTQMQVRRGTAASWTSTNPTLAAGEWGLETDTGKTKIGNGSTAWASLPYASLSVTAGTGISVSTASNVSTVTNTMATTIDAKGDLVAGTGADTFSRLAAGANGLFLTTDSAEATGLKWSTVPGTSTAGTAKISSGFGATTYTYSLTMNPGAYNVYVWNSNGTSGYVAAKLTFGSTTIDSRQTVTWATTIYPPVGLGNVNTVILTTNLSSFSINNRDSAQWTSKANNLTVNTNANGGTTFGNNTFVQVLSSSGNVYATSTDGLTWTTRAYFGNTDIRFITFGNGIFVGAQANGFISTSTDAITWTTRVSFGATNIGSQVQPPAIKYISGLTFPWAIVVTNSTNASNLVSTDGITWTTSLNAGAAETYLGYTGSNNFATVKRIAWTSKTTAPNAYYTAGDNFIWVSRATPSIYPGICSIETDGSKYVMVTDGGGNANDMIYTSTDGITWTQRIQERAIPTIIGNSFRGRTSIFYNATLEYKWIMTGNSGVTQLSTDGITWQLTNGGSLPTTVTFGLSKWVNVDQNNTREITTSNGSVFGDTYVSVTPAGSVTTLV